MNCLVTLNTNKYQTENSRRSLSSAAERWGADYVEVHSTTCPNLHPSYEKSSIVLRLQNYDRVCYFDADILINSRAPSIFESFPDRSCLYVVGDLTSTGISGIEDDAIQCVRVPYYQPLKENTNIILDREVYLTKFFNGGFFLCDPTVSEVVFRTFRELLPAPDSQWAGNAHYEQALFNYLALSLIPSSLIHVDRTWNFIQPDVNIPMSKYVYHFTGFVPEIKTAISTFRWET